VQYSIIGSDSPPDPPRRPALALGRRYGRRLTPAIQFLGLIATGWIIWISAVSPRLHRFTWSSLVIHALAYAVFAWAWSACVTFGLYLTIPADQRDDLVRASLRTSTAAVWFAPAIILFTQLSPAALAASLALVVTATRLLYTQWRLIHPLAEAPPLIVIPTGMFGENEPPPPFFLKAMAPALAVAFCFQAGVLTLLMELPLLAGCFLAASAAVMTVYAISIGLVEIDRRRTLPQAAFGAILTLILASGLTVGGLSGRVIQHPRMANEFGRAPHNLIESLRAVLRQVFYGEQPPGTKDANEPERPKDAQTAPPREALPESGPFPDGSFPGVILLPEVRPVPLLVAPRPANYGLNGMPARPFGIPFGGEYWFYRFMYRRPPFNSFYRKGRPDELSFSTTDHWPLQMEARQDLDDPIDLSCCRKIQIQIWNADRYPDTVSLELSLLESEVAHTPALYLGKVPVESKPDLTREPVTPVPELLDFPVPEGTTGSYSVLRVMFHRARSRAHKSARVAIERFILVP
jgi:hypothetical protein